MGHEKIAMGEKIGLSPEDARTITGLVKMIKEYPRPNTKSPLGDVMSGALVPVDFRNILEEIDTILGLYPEEVREPVKRGIWSLFHINTIVPPPVD